jgi:hypothetical protein
MGPAPALTDLRVAGDLAPWATAGFAVDDDGATLRLGSVRVRGGAAGPTGLTAWSLSGVDDGTVDGLLTVTGGGPATPADHPNGTVAIDHLVITSPDLDRTTRALESVGVELRRVRDAGSMEQRFFRAGEVVLEVIGRAGASGSGPSTFWGLALTVSDLDATAALLGEHLGPAKDAVQPGRRIATLRHELAGVPVPIAFLSSPPPRPSS